MSWWCHLFSTDFDGIYPGQQYEDFKDTEHIVLLSGECIPLLWLFMFEEQDIRTASLTCRDQSVAEFLAPVVSRHVALDRLSDKARFMDELFQSEGGLAHHRQLFSDYLSKCSGKHCTIDLEELEVFYGQRQIRALLFEALAFLQEKSPLAKTPLKELATIIPNRRFMTLEDAAHGCEDEDWWNYFRIMGGSYCHEVPWG